MPRFFKLNKAELDQLLVLKKAVLSELEQTRELYMEYFQHLRKDSPFIETYKDRRARSADLQACLKKLFELNDRIFGKKSEINELLEQRSSQKTFKL